MNLFFFILFWVKRCLCFCHSIQDNLCKGNSTWIICHSLCLLKVVVLVLATMVYSLCMSGCTCTCIATMVYSLCMSGCTCTCILAGFLQMKPLMKTDCFACVAARKVSWRLSKSAKQIYSMQMKMTIHKRTSKECNLKILVMSNFSHVFFLFFIFMLWMVAYVSLELINDSLGEVR